MMVTAQSHNQRRPGLKPEVAELGISWVVWSHPRVPYVQPGVSQ